jgi:hypothetical protein
MDRESVFADDEVIRLLRDRYVPVALDEWYHVRKKDGEGDFYRKVVFQREGLKPGSTTQGFYIASPDGKLLRGWNNRDVPKVKRYLSQALAGYRPAESGELKDKGDARFERTAPEGGLILRVFSRITEAEWPPEADPWVEILRRSKGRDHLWVRKDEAESLLAGRMAPSLLDRIARYHLIDNTRGEPPLWTKREIRAAKLELRPEGAGFRLQGEVKLETEKGDRGYQATLLGFIESKEGRLTRFDLVSRGEFFGEGTYTGHAPPGKFTLAVGFALAEEGEDLKVPPQGARDLDDYLGMGRRHR